MDRTLPSNLKHCEKETQEHPLENLIVFGNWGESGLESDSTRESSSGLWQQNKRGAWRGISPKSRGFQCEECLTTFCGPDMGHAGERASLELFWVLLKRNSSRGWRGSGVGWRGVRRSPQWGSPWGGQPEKQKVEGDQQQTAEEKLHTLRSWEEALATGFAGKPLKRLPRETASLKNLSQPENTEPGTRVRG